MTFDEWRKKYQPVENHLDGNASFDGRMFETFGKELKHVLSQPKEMVWTWVDDGEHSSITNGYCLINRQGYFIASKPYDEAEPFTDIDLNEDG